MKHLTFNTIISAIVAIGLLVWIIDRVDAIKTPQIEEYCPPLGNPKPIQSAYRTYYKLTVNTYDTDSLIFEGRDYGLAVHVIELSEGKEDYFFMHNGQRVDFKFRRQMVEKVCIEYVLYEGKRISVKVNEVW